MPLYMIQHICPLTPSQQDELADAITSLHSTRFTTPRMFVNVRFVDAKNSDAANYIGGKRRSAGNNIIGNVRVGPSRTQQDWNDLTKDIWNAWNGIVPMPKVKRSAPDEDYTLRSCILLGGLIGGMEAGFMLPQAGHDVQWIRDNWDEFEMKAKSGDEEFQDLVAEVKERGLMDGEGKSAKEKLEEMLGWGDSA